MIYSLEFDARALKEWQKLGGHCACPVQEVARRRFAGSPDRGQSACWSARLLQDQAAQQRLSLGLPGSG